jgi:hypothetical protein
MNAEQIIYQYMLHLVTPYILNMLDINIVINISVIFPSLYKSHLTPQHRVSKTTLQLHFF